MKTPRVPRRLRDVRLDDLKDEKVVFVDQSVIGKFAFEIGVTFADQRRVHMLRLLRRQPERGEFVDLRPRGVADADHLVGQRCRRQVDHALAAAAHEFEAVISRGDHAADKRRIPSPYASPWS